ncbi:hypothetical protein JVU11DRAFT_8460 [Chiua virens]|nr:hypothetical protein JVU11DRAFT_8460 [Chiua virens]
MPFSQSGDTASASIAGAYNDVGHDQINNNHTEIAFSPTMNDNKKTVNNYSHNFSGINENVGNTMINYGGNTTNSFVDNSFRSNDDHSKHENVVFGVPSSARAASQDLHAFNNTSSIPHSTTMSPSRAWTDPSDTATDPSHSHIISHGLQEARTMVKGWWKKHHNGFGNTAHASDVHHDAAPMLILHVLSLQLPQRLLVLSNHPKQLETGQTTHENELELELAKLKLMDDTMKERPKGGEHGEHDHQLWWKHDQCFC